MEKYSVFDCSIVELDRHHSDRKGNLTVVENGKTLPFDVKRVYYLYMVPEVARGAHAHKELQQLLIATSGSVDVIMDDGTNKATFHLDKPWKGLYVPAGLWRDLENFSGGAVLLCLASEHYDENDYIRNYYEFLNYKQL